MLMTSHRIEWSSEFNTGVKIIDEQHHKLIGMINDYGKDLLAGLGFKKIDIVLKEMVNYVKLHFTTEEGLMKKHEFQGYKEHKNIHDSFTLHLAEYIKRYHVGDRFLGLEVHRYLREWFVDYILNHTKYADKDLGEYLNRRGIN
ncbi:MAG: hemerythrin family protein [FCB group bacterium]|nr:hemerythrin family protein [FCB group bacterium]